MNCNLHFCVARRQMSEFLLRQCGLSSPPACTEYFIFQVKTFLQARAGIPESQSQILVLSELFHQRHFGHRQPPPNPLLWRGNHHLYNAVNFLSPLTIFFVIPARLHSVHLIPSEYFITDESGDPGIAKSNSCLFRIILI